MRNAYKLTFAFFVVLFLSACFKDEAALEKGAGYYNIEKKEILIFDSSFSLQSNTVEKDYGYLVLYAKSGGSSSAKLITKGSTLTFGSDTSVSSGWEVMAKDEKRFIFSRIFTLSGWGSNNITLTYLKNPYEREIFYLKRD
jgi:hypothetical protein